MNTAETVAARARRSTPTERQIAQLMAMDLETLIQWGCDALHALNRRAKKMRDQACAIAEYGHGRWRRGWGIERAIRDEIADIYGSKTTFLVALLQSGRGKLYRYEVEGRDYYCASCDREWRGGDTCFGCGDEGCYLGNDTWHIVEVGGHRFHQPAGSIPLELTAKAAETEPHDPTQPQREIPKIGLTIAAQRRAVEIVIERLSPPT